MYQLIIIMIMSYFNGLYPKEQMRAIEYAPIVIEESIKAEINPLIVATNITFESGWRSNRRGPCGEIGLTQVKTSRWQKREALLGSPEYQIREGARIMAEKIEQCGGDLLRAFEAYRSGTCAITKQGRERYRYFMKYHRFYLRYVM